MDYLRITDEAAQNISIESTNHPPPKGIEDDSMPF